MDEQLIDRACGCIVGLALGDAMGAPIEGLSAAEIMRRQGEVTGFFEMQTRPSEDVPAPQSRYRMKAAYTDDTQLTLAVLDSLVLCKGFNADHLAGQFARLTGDREGSLAWVLRGSGRSTRAAMERIRGGAGWRESGVPSPSDGAAMRVAPIGLFFRDDREALLLASIQQAMITHRDPRAMPSAAAIASAVATLVGEPSEGGLEVDAFMHGLIEDVRHAEELVSAELASGKTPQPDRSMSTILAEVHQHLDLPDADVLAHIAARADPLTERKITHGTESFCLAAVPSSIFFLVRHAASFERVIISAINAGKDTDTVGAMAGALAGAYLGHRAVPLDWVLELRNGDQIYYRVQDWLKHGRYGDKVFDLHAMEHRLRVEEVWKIKQIKARARPTPATIQRPCLGQQELDGRWVMQILGVASGSPAVGRCLEALRQALEQGVLETIEDAEALVRRTAGITD